MAALSEDRGVRPYSWLQPTTLSLRTILAERKPIRKGKASGVHYRGSRPGSRSQHTRLVSSLVRA
jgi:hypothetical protein